MSVDAMAYKKGKHHANARVLSTDDGRFQGMVELSHEIQGETAQRHLVPGASDTPEEAFDEAKALAHRLLANLQ